MEVIHPRCAGLHVHKETMVACVRLALGKDVSCEIETFETTTLANNLICFTMCDGNKGASIWPTHQGP